MLWHISSSIKKFSGVDKVHLTPTFEFSWNQQKSRPASAMAQKTGSELKKGPSKTISQSPSLNISNKVLDAEPSSLSSSSSRILDMKLPIKPFQCSHLFGNGRSHCCGSTKTVNSHCSTAFFIRRQYRIPFLINCWCHLFQTLTRTNQTVPVYSGKYAPYNKHAKTHLLLV